MDIQDVFYHGKVIQISTWRGMIQRYQHKA